MQAKNKLNTDLRLYIYMVAIDYETSSRFPLWTNQLLWREEIEL